MLTLSCMHPAMSSAEEWTGKRTEEEGRKMADLQFCGSPTLTKGLMAPHIKNNFQCKPTFDAAMCTQSMERYSLITGFEVKCKHCPKVFRFGIKFSKAEGLKHVATPNNKVVTHMNYECKKIPIDQREDVLMSAQGRKAKDELVKLVSPPSPAGGQGGGSRGKLLVRMI